MLNHTKVMRELQEKSRALFVTHDIDYEGIKSLWNSIAHDAAFAYKLRAMEHPYQVPLWTGLLGEVVQIPPINSHYTALAVDGSQVYPDRHQGAACFLLNIGSVRIAYGVLNNPVYVDTEPHVFVNSPEDGMNMSAELVDCLRQEYELSAGVTLYKEHIHAQQTSVLMFDGSLIFWHLAAQTPTVKNRFVQSYCAVLEQLYAERAYVCWYTSLPKGKDIVNILRAAAQTDAASTHLLKQLDFALDTTLAHFYLSAGERSIIFKHTHPLCADYPPHLAPHFFYLHAGNEVVRIEVPAWLAADEQAINTIAAVALDQAHKGRGYPVVLAEAHEQAVVKGPDRDFFYHLLAKVTIEHKQRLIFSQKSMKKRGLGI
jgi:hypothetical protein